MAAATVVTQPDGCLATEVVVLTASNGDTYTTRLSGIYSVLASYVDSGTATMGTAVLVPYFAPGGTSRTVNIYKDDMTSKNICLVIHGRL